MNKIKIGNKFIGEGQKPYFIADIASNHDGDIQRAFKLIELAKEAGADAAKFQNFKAEKIVSKIGFESLGKQISHQSFWNKSVFEVYKDASIEDNWTKKLKQKCDEYEIEYMTSPYDFEAVDLVNTYVNAFKIGSGDITWTDIIEYIASKKKPIIIATGASTLEDVKRAIESIQIKNDNMVLMQCNTNYNMSYENYKHINLNVLKSYKKLFPNVILGLSDHTQGHSTVLGAIALGACVIEKHFTDDNSRTGPDHKFSMNPSTWREMINRSIELWYALGDGIKKIEDNEKDTEMIQRRGLYYTKDLISGTILTKEHIIPLRPIKKDGLHPWEMDCVLGKTIARDVSKGNYIKLEDIE